MEMGLDYLVDDLSLETNFNIQLGRNIQWFRGFKRKKISISQKPINY
jgi:hypothetical protein